MRLRDEAEGADRADVREPVAVAESRDAYIIAHQLVLYGYGLRSEYSLGSSYIKYGY